MKSLSKIFSINYNYYHDNSKVELYSGDSKKYIREYFTEGGKDDVASFIDTINIDPMRFDHMRSVYNIGVWLYDSCDILRKHINDELKKTNQDLRLEFLYRWYLTCLFHDIGYCYERDPSPPQDFNNLQTKINNGLKGYDLIFSCNNYIPQEYQDSFLKYYQYTQMRRKNKNPNIRSIDHGISSAIKLYDFLQGLHCGETHPEPSNLRWGPEILKSSVVPAVWYILAHNIWPAVKHTDRAKRYKDKGLSNLIQRYGRSFIKFNQHPVLFLLCFIDTVEPIKLLQQKDNLSIIQCLESVKMAVDHNCIHIGFNAKEICPDSCLASKFHDYYLAAIVKNLNFLVCGNFKIADGDNEIVCFLNEEKSKDTSQDSQQEQENSNLVEDADV